MRSINQSINESILIYKAPNHEKHYLKGVKPLDPIVPVLYETFNSKVIFSIYVNSYTLVKVFFFLQYFQRGNTI